MRVFACLAAAAAVLLSAAAPGVSRAQSFEDEVLAEMNRARAHPAEFARELQRAAALHRASYSAVDYGQDNAEAVAETVAFLLRQRPLPPLAADPRIAVAASEHVAEQGPRGALGHGAAGSLGRRLQGQGVWAGLYAENISYGDLSPTEVVRALIIDQNVPDRGHRLNIFGASYQLAGVACGPHAAWGGMCVIDFAGAVVRR